MHVFSAINRRTKQQVHDACIRPAAGSKQLHHPDLPIRVASVVTLRALWAAFDSKQGSSFFAHAPHVHLWCVLFVLWYVHFLWCVHFYVWAHLYMHFLWYVHFHWRASWSIIIRRSSRPRCRRLSSTSPRPRCRIRCGCGRSYCP